MNTMTHGSSLFSVEPHSGLESRSDRMRVAVDFSPRTKSESRAVAERRLNPLVQLGESRVSSVAPRRQATWRSTRGLKSTATFTRSLRDRVVAISVPAIPATLLPPSFIPPKTAKNPTHDPKSESRRWGTRSVAERGAGTPRVPAAWKAALPVAQASCLLVPAASLPPAFGASHPSKLPTATSTAKSS
jgi:hypothetical protein